MEMSITEEDSAILLKYYPRCNIVHRQGKTHRRANQYYNLQGTRCKQKRSHANKKLPRKQKRKPRKQNGSEK